MSLKEVLGLENGKPFTGKTKYEIILISEEKRDRDIVRNLRFFTILTNSREIIIFEI